MRIACVHIPQFALQCVTRCDPGLLRERPAVAVVISQQRHAPIVTACSRAAWALGVRPGMPAAAAHALSPDLAVVPADAASERELVRALADVLLALSPVVDVGRRVGACETHLALYAEVPSKMRGSSFGERVLERLAAFGITARVGIADDRFTAWVAAISEHDADGEGGSITTVPRGGSAAFLAPRSLSLLAITPEVQHMLESLGVTTLGEFAALPAPSHAVMRPFEADYRALARGEGGHALRPYAPEAPIREEVALRHGTSAPAAVALLAERVSLRLTGRARGAARIEVMASGEGGEWLMPVSLADGTSAEQLADAIGAALSDHPSLWRLRVVVTGERLLGEPEVVAREEAPALPAPAQAAAPVDALAVVLSSTGAFGLRAERRALHRGTRRSKAQRNQRRTANAQTELVQARLFKS